MQLDLEEDKTTYKHDYKNYKVVKHCPEWKRAQYNDFKDIKTKPLIYEDHETFDKRPEGVHIPFNLLWVPKPITQTHPQHSFIRKPFLKDSEFKSKDRPRVVMSPAVSLDDAREILADEPENQDLLAKYTYTTTWQKASQDAALPVSPRNIPTTHETTADPMQYHAEDPNLIPKELKRFAKDWDKSQSRYVCDPTRSFWERRAMQVKCGACEQNRKGRDMVDNETRQKIKMLINEDHLRLAHDSPLPGYAGFRPILPVGIPLEKPVFKASDSRLSMSHAYNMWSKNPNVS